MLILAWALGSVVKDVQTAEYLSGALETGIQAYVLPAMISVSSASTAHAILPQLGVTPAAGLVSG